MEDYLDLIRNPRRQSNNAPTISPSNRPRASSPIPTSTGGSSTNQTNSSYINKLDKIKAVNLQQWGNSNPSNPGQSQTFPSSQNTNIENKYVPVQIPRNQGNLFPPLGNTVRNPSSASASNSNSARNNQQDYSTGNLFGQYIPSNPNPVFFPQEQVKRNNVPSNIITGQGFGNNERQNRFFPSSDNPYLGQNSNLFGTGAINNEVTKRMTSVSPNISNSKKDANLSDQSMRSQKPKFAPSSERDISSSIRPSGRNRGRSVSPVPRSAGGKKKNGVEITLILLGILLIVSIVSLINILSPINQKIYCDTDSEILPTEGCTPCPDHGICEEGKFLSCEDDYVKQKNMCLKDPKVDAKFSKYRKHINNLLAVNKGEKMCNPIIKDEFTFEEIEIELFQRYPEEKNLSPDSLSFKREWERNFRENEGLHKRNGVYYSQDDPNPTFSCKMKLLWREGKIFGLWLLFFISSIIVSIKLVARHLVYSRLASEMYEDIISHLSYWKSCSVKSLKREFENKYPGKNFSRIWRYVEDCRKKDAQIYQYFDTYQGLSQEFWLIKH